jgi:hypothetical protein
MYVNGAGFAYLANESRDDVNRAFGIGGQHGFSETVQLNSGSNSICVFGIGQAENNNTLISCRDIQAGQVAQQRFSALGAAPETSDATTDSAATETEAANSSTARDAGPPTEVSGSSSATESSAPATTVLPVPSSTVAPTAAGGTGDGVVSVPESPAPFTSSPPSTVVTTPLPAPAAKGALDSPVMTGQTGALTGWIADPAAGPISTRVRITINGVTHDVLADKQRVDVAQATGTPVPWGFVDTISLSRGANEICLYEVDRDNTIVTAPVACRTENIS